MVFFIQKWAPRLGRPSFYSAAAAVVVAAVVVIVVAAVAAAAVAHQQDQNDDPPPVVTAEAIADIVVTAHKNTSKKNFPSGLPLIPWYSGGPKMCRPFPRGKTSAR